MRLCPQYALPILSLACALSAPAPAQTVCPGDCGVDGFVAVDELVLSVRVALGDVPLERCASLARPDATGAGIEDLVGAVGHALNGCPAAAIGQAAFYQTLAGVADRNEETVARLDEAVVEDPGDGWSYFLLGMMHLLRLGRDLTDPGAPSEFARQEAMLAREALDAAVPLLPNDARIPGFRGAATYNAGFLNDDPTLIELGLAQLDGSVALYPLFNSFSFVGAVAPTVPPDDPLFAEAVLLTDAAINSGCTPFNQPRVCGNGGRAPRNIEGSFMLFGDIYAKAGDLERALQFYTLSLQIPGSETWRFRSIAEMRVAGAAERVAAYQDEDRENDPPLVGSGPEACAYCHYR